VGRPLPGWAYESKTLDAVHRYQDVCAKIVSMSSGGEGYSDLANTVSGRSGSLVTDGNSSVNRVIIE
jgi:hypothetical protein